MKANIALLAELPQAEFATGATVPQLSWKGALAHAAAAIGTFHLAYSFSQLSFLMLVYLYGLARLAGLPTARQAFYFGLAIGYAVYAPHLSFFWTIFGWPAVALWTVLAFWLGLFVALARLCRNQFSNVVGSLLIPFVWMGLEYFRSELYFLRFSWLNVGFAFSELPHFFAWSGVGVYGVSFSLMALAVLPALFRWRTAALVFGICFTLLGVLTNLPHRPAIRANGDVRAIPVAGLQMEFPAPLEVPSALDRLLAKHPEAELLVLSEYTFDDSIPERVKAWCRQHKKFLIAGGKDFVSDAEFYNTVFVIGPDGEIVFRQAKSVPIQFFKDGLPAGEQKLWESPWGKVGICVCYDLSYRRVIDRLVQRGAQAIIAPTMDMAEWGNYQHKLHGRIGPVRAAEYSLPVFRLCSSGISQLIDRTGRVVASAPFPGQGESLSGRLEIRQRGRLPLDHWLAPLAEGVTVGMIIWLTGKTMLRKFSRL